MRTPVRSILSVVTLGVLATSYQIGQATASDSFSALASGSATPSASGTPTSQANTPAESASPTPSELASASASATPTPTPAKATPSATPTKTSAPTPTKTATPTATPTKTATPSQTSTSSGSTQTSSLIQYRYGMIQLSVTKSNGKITDVGLVTATATAGRDQAFSYLVDYAIQSNGAGFGNLSGATFTTQAFKKALDSALAKF